MIPFTIEGEPLFENGDYIYIPEVKKAIVNKSGEISAYIVKDGNVIPFTLNIGEITDDERKIFLDGCLINFYADK